MRIAIPDARALIEASMQAVDHSPEEAAVIADHLIDCELRGVAIGGLSRALTVIEYCRGLSAPRCPITVSRDSACSASITGGGQVGYLVGHRAATIAIGKAKASKIGIVGAADTAYTGMLSYYMEMATREGFFAMASAGSARFVAPHGGSEGRFGTNPLAFGFPSTQTPVIYDIGTSSMMLSDVVLHGRLGKPLPEGMAFDSQGQPTRDPAAALAGALTVWGGHKGSGLALVIQMLGMLCGAEALPARAGGTGFFIMVLDPDLLTSGDDFRQRIADYADAMRATRPVDPAVPVRVPFDRSVAERAKRLSTGHMDVPDVVYDALVRVVEEHSAA